MKLTKREIVKIHRGIEAIQGTGDKYIQNFSYALSRNKRILQPIVDSIIDSEKIHLDEYAEDIDQLNKKYAVLNERGKPNITNGMIKIDDLKFLDYEEEKKTIDKQYEKEIKENIEFLKTEEDIKFFMIDNSNFPDMDGSLADTIFELRKEEKI